MGKVTYRSVEEQWERRRKRLATEIESCLTGGIPSEINLSIPKHSVTAPVLRRFVYDERFRGRSIPIVFRDASRSQPFPISCFRFESKPANVPEVAKIGLSSFRHPDMDYLVDLYLLRNKDLNDEVSMADEEALSFKRTVEVLSDPVLDKGGELGVFHTGLEPMIVGFYRGVVKVLQERIRRGLPRNLVITPWLYPSGPSKDRISPNSPGAKLDSYISAEYWC